MRTRTSWILPILAIVVGFGMIVSALVLSNTLVYTNEVQGITLSSTWSDGARTLGAENDFTVSYIAPAGSPAGVISFNLSKTGIVPADVTLQYFNGVGWVTATFAQNGPNTIACSTLATAGGPSSGGVDCKLWYNAPGTYTMHIWAA